MAIFVLENFTHVADLLKCRERLEYQMISNKELLIIIICVKASFSTVRGNSKNLKYSS